MQLIELIEITNLEEGLIELDKKLLHVDQEQYAVGKNDEGLQPVIKSIDGIHHCGMGFQLGEFYLNLFFYKQFLVTWSTHVPIWDDYSSQPSYEVSQAIALDNDGPGGGRLWLDQNGAAGRGSSERIWNGMFMNFHPI